ncbi:MAG: hypothetical protein J3R72DRAFT_447274 [Linnemannia gamsii]|nr:MAG: hypothetical protein J3R72DRAFT_447274 [Linnemannia gamsii]
MLVVMVSIMTLVLSAGIIAPSSCSVRPPSKACVGPSPTTSLPIRVSSTTSNDIRISRLVRRRERTTEWSTRDIEWLCNRLAFLKEPARNRPPSRFRFLVRMLRWG